MSKITKTVSVEIHSTYRKYADGEPYPCTCRAKTGTTVDGRPYITLTQRQINGARDKICYAGEDYAIPQSVLGYTEWSPCGRDEYVAYSL